MKNLSRTILIFIAAILASKAGAHSDGKYHSNFTEEIIAVDGNLNEKAWEKAKKQGISGKIKESRSDSGDFSAIWMSLWDHNFLYLALEVTDDKIIPAKRSNGWMNDMIELYIDIENNQCEQRQYQIFPMLKEESKPAFIAVPSGKSLIPRWAKAGVKKTPKGYIIELAISLKYFIEESGVGITPGTSIGLDICVKDNDAQKRKRIKSLYWSGDGTNWRNASANGQLFFSAHDKQNLNIDKSDFIPSYANNLGWGLWNDPSLFAGRFNLEIQCKSYNKNNFSPWNFGDIKSSILNDPASLTNYKYGFLGACGLGEKLEPPRFIYNTLYNENTGDEFTRITSLFHPAREYRTNSKELVIFSGMPECGQPTGPMWVCLPLKGKCQIRKVTGETALYDKEKDGTLDSGWLLVFFSSPDDGRENDLPILVNFSQNPEKIETPKANARTGAIKGLKFEYPKKQLRSYSLMPLYGAESIDKEKTLSWLKAKKLPGETIKRIEFWHLACLKLPVQMEEKFRIDQGAKRIEILSRFSYTENLSEWRETPILLSPISPFLALSSRFMPYGNPKLKNLDMPLEKGPYCAAVGTDTLSYKLTIPGISMDFAGINLEKLKTDPVCDKYLKELNDERFFKWMNNRIQVQLKKKTPMPHVAVTWEWTRAYPFLTEKNKERFKKFCDEAFEKAIFNPSLKDKMYPRLYAYNTERLSYMDLTVPYGCPEPFWNIGRVLAALGDYSYFTNDYSIYKREWPFVKEMAHIIWAGGFYHFRYDGGLTLGAVLEGLIRTAYKLGDKDFYNQALFTYTQYAHTIAGFYQIGEWAKKKNLRDSAGNSVESKGGDVQVLTRMSKFYKLAESKSRVTTAFDISYGNFDLLREFAKDEIAHIDYELFPKYRKDWWKLRDWEHPMCLARRFGVRALTLREPPEKLQEYITLLMAQKRFKNDINAPYEVLESYLFRINQDTK